MEDRHGEGADPVVALAVVDGPAPLADLFEFGDEPARSMMV